MDTDLDDALTLLSKELGLSIEAAEEYLVLLEQTETDRFNSVLFPENQEHCIPVCVLGFKRAWFLVKKVYVHSFACVVVETSRGNRAIIYLMLAS